MLVRLAIALLSLALFPQCRTEEPPATVSGSPAVARGGVAIGNSATSDLKILFVGNSLTYDNDLPSLVVEIAAMDGVEVSTRMIARGDYAIEDHLNDGSVQEALKTSGFTYVVAQQGPSALPESQINLREAALRLAQLCREYRTTMALYMVWPSQQRDFDRDQCIASYTNAARASGALLCPAGKAWKKAWARKASLPLYGPDRFHPSIHGSVLAAMTIYAKLQSKKSLDFIDLQKASFSQQVSQDDLEVMKHAAIESIQD